MSVLLVKKTWFFFIPFFSYYQLSWICSGLSNAWSLIFSFHSLNLSALIISKEDGITAIFERDADKQMRCQFIFCAVLRYTSVSQVVAQNSLGLTIIYRSAFVSSIHYMLRFSRLSAHNLVYHSPSCDIFCLWLNQQSTFWRSFYTAVLQTIPTVQQESVSRKNT